MCHFLDGFQCSCHVVFDDSPVFSCFEFVLHCLGALPGDVSMGYGLVGLANVLVLDVLFDF